MTDDNFPANHRFLHASNADVLAPDQRFCYVKGKNVFGFCFQVKIA